MLVSRSHDIPHAPNMKCFPLSGSSPQNPDHSLRNNFSTSPLSPPQDLIGKQPLSLFSTHTTFLSTSLPLSFIFHKMRRRGPLHVIKLLHDNPIVDLYFLGPQNTEWYQECGRYFINDHWTDLVEPNQRISVTRTGLLLEVTRKAVLFAFQKRHGGQQGIWLEIRETSSVSGSS